MLTFNSTGVPSYPALAFLQQCNYKKMGAPWQRFTINSKYDGKDPAKYMKFTGHSHFQQYCKDFWVCMQYYENFYSSYKRTPNVNI